MFGKKTGVKNTIDSLIGVGTRIEGDVYFVGGLRVDGHVKGNVIAESEDPSTLVVSEQARIDGQVSVTHLVLNGVINGAVCARDLLELQPKARLTGDVQYRTLEMHHGAIVDGTLSYADDARPGLKLASNNG